MTNSIINLSIDELKEIINEAAKAGAFEVLGEWHKQEQERDIILKTEGVARLFGVSHTTIIKWRQEGVIPFYTIGSAVYFRKNEVLEALMTKNNKLEMDEISLAEIAKSLIGNNAETKKVIIVKYCEIYKKTLKQSMKMVQRLIEQKAIIRSKTNHMRFVLPDEQRADYD